MTVWVQVGTAQTTENPAPSPAFFTVYQSPIPSTATTINYSLGGTATTPGTNGDYQAIGTITIPAFSPSYNVNITPVDDSIGENQESVIFTILAGSYTIGTPSSGTVYINDNDGGIQAPMPLFVLSGLPVCTQCGPDKGDVVSSSSDGKSSGVSEGLGESGFSSHPVRYADGTVLVRSQDLWSDGFGTPWGITREWTNGKGYARSNVVGDGMVITEQPVLVQVNGTNTIAIITDGHTARYFDYDMMSFGYVSRGFQQEKLTYNSGSDEYVLTSIDGGEFRFFGYSGTTSPALKRGQFKSFTDAYGNVTSVTSHTTDGRIAEVQRSATVGMNTTTESFLYAYVSAGTNIGLIESVTQRQRENLGSWTTQRKVEYTYYGTSDTNGNAGDLKTAVIKDGAGSVLDTTYYRYYKPSQANGYTHGLKYVLYPESYARVVAEVASNPDTATDSAIAPYADHYFEFDTDQRATEEVAQGAGCSSCGGGQGTFTYSYSTSTHADGYNSWETKTVETLPDGNQNIVYTNYRGQVMLHVFRDTVASQDWSTFYRYDTSGRLILSAEPSAVSGYNDTNADLLVETAGNFTYLRDSAGLVTAYTYHASTTATTTTPGGAKGYLNQVSIRNGETATASPQNALTYIARTSGNKTVYLPAASTVYTNINGTGSLSTTYAYSFYSGVGVQSVTTTHPVGSSDQDTVYFDAYGLPAWAKDAKGFLHYTEYDRDTGAVSKVIADVDTTRTTEFSGKPSGWTTPTGGGLHAVTSYEIDGLGRPTKETDSNGNVAYIVYDDDNHEFRLYPGWNTANNMPTGPTIVSRSDRAGSYVETLTMSATPTVVSNRPTGTEAISGLQSLSRTHFNDAGQAIQTDDYFYLTGLTYSTSASLGTLNTHFYRTTDAHDSRGRHSKVVRPDGTIYRTVFDGLGRPVSDWVGDNDTPVSGTWSPTNPAGMVKMQEYQYDAGGIGDSHLTRLTDALGRQTAFGYDFRGRLLQTTLPDPDGAGTLTSPVYATAYDNLSRVTSETDPLSNVTTYAYNLTTRTVTTTLPDPDGPPDGLGGGLLTSPIFVQSTDALGNVVSTTDPLSAVTSYEFDGLSRLKKITQSDPDGGGSLTSPITQYAYDLNNNLRYVTDPLGNVTESTYDKINRPLQLIQADPDGAGSLTSPITTSVYDAAGWLASVTDPLSRATAYEYDHLGRLKIVTSPDPDGAGSLTSPVTLFGYDGANRVTSITDPLNQVTTRAYNFFDQLITLTEPDPDGGGSLTSPVTTFTYNTLSELLSVTDPMSRLTSLEYDNLGRRTKVTQPEPDGGGPLARPYTTFTYDASSNLIGVTDPLTHTTHYTFDKLNRRTTITDALSGETSFTYDAASRMLTLKDPVNNTTTWAYDTLGRPTSETNQFSNTRMFKYDAVGNLTERIDRLGRKIVWEYDNLYRNTFEKWYDGITLVRSILFDYDAANQLTEASDVAASYGYEYDNLGRVKNESQSLAGLSPLLVFERGFDAGSNITSIQAIIGGTADFKNDYTFDNLSRLTRLQQQDVSGGNVVADKRIDFGYDASSAYTQISRYADQAATQHVASSHYSYDGMGRLQKLVHSTSTTPPASGWGTPNPLAGYQYVYDTTSRIASIDSYIDGLTTYNHDNTDQLTAADHTGQTDETYTFDANGNRIMTGHTVGTNNQLSTDGTYNYIYDDEGNRLTKTTISNGDKEEYTWDHRNRLVNVTFKNSAGTVNKTVDQTYDAFNRWIKRSVDPDGATGSASIQDTYLSYENGQIVFQFDGGAASDLTNRYLWAEAVDQLLADEQVTALTSAGNVLWPLGDHLGTLRDIADRNESTGVTTVTNHRRYDSFGNLISETNAAVDEFFGYTGRAFNEAIGLQDNWNRPYDPVSGQWLSEDPIGFSAGDTNTRRYVGNHPTIGTDPTGLDEPYYEGYLPEVGYTAKGYFWNGPKNFAFGLGEMVLHPVKTAEGLAFVVQHPIQTARHLRDDYSQKLETGEGQGEVAFDIALTVCTLGSSAGVNAADKLNKAQKTAVVARTAASVADGLVPLTDDLVRLADDIPKLANQANGTASSIAQKTLLPNEGLVGTYDDLIAMGAKGDDITPHHIPSAKHMEQHGVSRGDGISINMEQPTPGVGGRHRQTFTYGNKADVDLPPRVALGRGVRDLRNIYQADDLYTPFMRDRLKELIQCNKQANPGLFD